MLHSQVGMENVFGSLSTRVVRLSICSFTIGGTSISMIITLGRTSPFINISQSGGNVHLGISFVSTTIPCLGFPSFG